MNKMHWDYSVEEFMRLTIYFLLSTEINGTLPALFDSTSTYHLSQKTVMGGSPTARAA